VAAEAPRRGRAARPRAADDRGTSTPTPTTRLGAGGHRCAAVVARECPHARRRHEHARAGRAGAPAEPAAFEEARAFLQRIGSRARLDAREADALEQDPPARPCSATTRAPPVCRLRRPCWLRRRWQDPSDAALLADSRPSRCARRAAGSPAVTPLPRKPAPRPHPRRAGAAPPAPAPVDERGRRRRGRRSPSPVVATGRLTSPHARRRTRPDPAGSGLVRACGETT
jgi:hypothetical protein